jgi:hypothetical protein
VYTTQGTFRLSGAAWAELLNNTARRATLVSSIQTDIAALLGIAPEYVVILKLSIGSLVIDFAVIQGSGKTSSQLLNSAVAASSSTTWLQSTKNVYALVSNETVTVLSVAVSAVEGGTTGAAVTVTAPPSTSSNSSTTTTSAGGTTTAPTTVAPTGISSPSSASTFSLVAAFAAALVAFAL